MLGRGRGEGGHKFRDGSLDAAVPVSQQQTVERHNHADHRQAEVTRERRSWA